MTATDSTDYPKGVISITDKGTGFAVQGYSLASGGSGAGAFGNAMGSQGNGVWGSAYNGNSAYGAVGLSDSGYGTVGVSWFRGGTAIIGYNFALDGGPPGIGVQSHGRLVVEGVTGDSAVQLPDNSIASHEILDEPGISQSYLPDGSVTITGKVSATTVDSTTITIPADGYIVVDVVAEAGFYGTKGENQLCHSLDTAGPPAFDYNYYACAGLMAYDTTTFANYFPLATRRAFYRHKGTYTFWFKALDGSPSGNKYIWEPTITATYFPKSYGAVISAQAPTGAPTASAPSQSDPRLVQYPEPGARPAGSVVDLRELELKAANLRAEAEAAQNELLKARLDKLKALEQASHGPK